MFSGALLLHYNSKSYNPHGGYEHENISHHLTKLDCHLFINGNVTTYSANTAALFQYFNKCIS